MQVPTEHHKARSLTVIQTMLAIASGMIIANVYYAQPLTGLISATLGLPHASTGLLATLPLAGYGIGLLTIVPLGDLFENRRLALALIAAEMVFTLALSFTTWASANLPIAFLIGLVASAVQLLVPYITYLVPEEARGRAVGRVVSGVMLGMVLPLAALVYFATERRKAAVQCVSASLP